MALQRYRVSISDWPGAPGVMTLYFATAVTDFTPVRTFCDALSNHMPNGIRFNFPTTVDLFDESTGTLTGSAVATTLTSVASIASAAAYSGTSGGLIRWNTGLISGGKRVSGRTFVVPLAGTSYANDGSLDNTVRGLIQTAANTMLTAFTDGLKVWSRPKPSVAGLQATIISATVPDLAVVMRSRRA